MSSSRLLFLQDCTQEKEAKFLGIGYSPMMSGLASIFMMLWQKKSPAEVHCLGG